MQIPLNADKKSNKISIGDAKQITRALGHDVVQHVRIASMYASILGRGELDDKQRGQVGIISEQLDRLHLTISGLVRWLRLADADLISNTCDLKQVWTEATSGLDGLFTNDQLPLVMADHALLTALFRELAINAIRYRLRPQAVHIRAVQLADLWQIEVVDSGPGIPASHHAQMLLPLHRMHAWDDIPGIGMGLAVAHRIAQRHHGALSITDTPGGGCTVQVLLPAL